MEPIHNKCFHFCTTSTLIILAILRLIAFALLTILYILGILLAGIFNRKERTALGLRRPFFIVIFWILGIKIKCSGRLLKNTALYVGNHISYLDPFILARFVDIWPVAKQEVATWPLIGYATRLAGIIFVKRESGKSRQATREAILNGLEEGRSILVYPEGTSTVGASVLPFHKGSFNLAAENQFPVVPVTISYSNVQAPFVGDDRFLPHFLKLFSCWRITSRLSIGDPIIDSNPDVLIQKTHGMISNQLKELKQDEFKPKEEL